jgi:integrase
LADRLGHSTTAVTSDIYQHVLPDLDRDAASKVAAFVFDERAEPQAGEGKV